MHSNVQMLTVNVQRR